MTRKNRDQDYIYQGVLTGLKLALFFLLSLVFLRYPIPWSICLSIAGGFCGGLIVAWWHSPDDRLERSLIFSQKLNLTLIPRRKKLGIQDAQKNFKDKMEAKKVAKKGSLWSFLFPWRKKD